MCENDAEECKNLKNYARKCDCAECDCAEICEKNADRVISIPP